MLHFSSSQSVNDALIRRVFAEVNNLLNQPLRYYQGTKNRTMQVEYYGVKVNAGFKINL